MKLETMRTWAEISLGNLEHNYRALRACAPDSKFLGVVKANAYGHGAVPVCRRLWKAGVRAFAVACLAEGIALRRSGVRGLILILGYTRPEDAPLLARWRLTQTVADADHGRALDAQGLR